MTKKQKRSITQPKKRTKNRGTEPSAAQGHQKSKEIVLPETLSRQIQWELFQAVKHGRRGKTNRRSKSKGEIKTLTPTREEILFLLICVELKTLALSWIFLLYRRCSIFQYFPYFVSLIVLIQLILLFYLFVLYEISRFICDGLFVFCQCLILNECLQLLTYNLYIFIRIHIINTTIIPGALSGAQQQLAVLYVSSSRYK